MKEIDSKVLIEQAQKHLGVHFKSYPALCRALQVEVKGGTNAKNSQLSEIKRYLKLVESGKKYIIEEIYKEPLEKTVFHGGARNVVPYIDNIKTLLLHLLGDAEGEVILSKHKLFECLHMINSNYRLGKRKITEIRQYTKVDKYTILEFFETVGGMLKRNLNNALDSLKNEFLIKYHEITMVYYLGEKEHRPANAKERKLILMIESKVAKSLGCETFHQVIKKRKWDEFIEEVKRQLRPHKILFYYEAYQITLNEPAIKNKLNQSELTLQQQILNNEISIRIRNNTTSRHNTALLELEEFWGEIRNVKLLTRTDSNYIDNYDRLINLLIDHECFNIFEIIDSQSKKSAT